jgi:hypothetical protein
MKRIALVVIMAAACACLFGEEIIDIFMANFEKANVNTKLQVLKDSIAKDIEGRGPLMNLALYYVINNYATLQNASREISFLAVNQVDTLLYKPAKTALWDLFLLDPTTHIREAILIALAHLANDDSEIIKKMNAWLSSQNDMFKVVKVPDLQVVTACIKTLGSIGDGSSFPPLLLVPFAGYPDSVRKEAIDALYKLKGSLRDHYIDMINSRKFLEKKYALEKALAETRLNNTEKCEVAFAALKIAINEVIDTQEEKSLSREIRNIATVFIGDNGYSEAADFMIAHFKRSLADYESNIINSSGFIPVIRALGQMKVHAPAVVLKDYLDSINQRFEEGKPYDEQIVLQVITSLKNLGDKIARSTLLYVGYLRYSDKIKKAADDAFKAIK